MPSPQCLLTYEVTIGLRDDLGRHMVILNALPLTFSSWWTLRGRYNKWKVRREQDWCYRNHEIDVVSVLKCCRIRCIHSNALCWYMCALLRVLCPHWYILFHIQSRILLVSGNCLVVTTAGFSVWLKIIYSCECTLFLCNQCVLPFSDRGTWEKKTVALKTRWTTETWQLPRMRWKRNRHLPSPERCPFFFFI